MTHGRIYPVPIKPMSSIGNWGHWPADVEPTLRVWNSGPLRGGGQLTFARGGIFKCFDCGDFCESHTHGRAVLNGDDLCDDCLIARARTA